MKAYQTNAMTTDYYDITIIGGGPVGMALALILRNSGISTLVLEARGLPKQVPDPRPLALAHGSRLILQRLSVWEKLPDTTPIATIHISNRGCFGRTVLTTRDAAVPTLGYVVNYHDLFRAMYETLQDHQADYLVGVNVTHFEINDDQGQVQFHYGEEEKKINTKLLVFADGGRLAERIEDISYFTHDYQQWAIVANIKAKISQSGIAYERFTPNGPIALLPSEDGFSLVWTLTPLAAKEVLALDDAKFLTLLHSHFGDRLGKFTQAGKRSGFPLSLRYATPITSRRIALIGNAAQTLHPVAGQGLNLGLRDAWGLGSEILTSITDMNEIGTSIMLSRYRQRRQIDSNAGRIFTDSLVKLFSNNHALIRNTCGLGLSALDCLPPLKQFVARRMIFGARS